MPLWGFLLILFGGLLVLGFLYDRFAGKRKLEQDVGSQDDPLNKAYGETLVNQSRNDTHNQF